MNKTIYAILAFVLLICSITAASGTVGVYASVTNPESTDLKATLINQDPDPAEPGGYADLRFKIENWGTHAASNVTVELVTKYPFSLGSGESATKNLGSITGIQLGSEGVIVKFRAKIDENAVDGENEIKLKYKTSADSGWVTTSAFNVSVQAHEAIISIDSVKSAPNVIAPGSNGLLNITIKNMASSLLRNVRVKLGLNDTPFSPVDSSNEKVLKTIEPGLKETISFSLITAPGTKADVYKVPVEIYYLDKLGKNYTKTHLIGLVVGSTPDLYIDVDSSTIYGAGSSGKVIVKFVNKGLANIKFLTVKLKETDNYEILSPETVYVGNIDSDDYETAEFTLFIKNADTSGKVLLPAAINYKDANNKDYSTDMNIELRIFSQEKLGMKKGNGTWQLILLIIVAVVGWFGYSGWKKNGKRKG